MKKNNIVISIIMLVGLLLGNACSAQEGGSLQVRLEPARGLCEVSACEGGEDGSKCIRFRLHNPGPVSEGDTLEPLPLVIFLHGAGERGRDNEGQMRLCVPYLLSDEVQSKQRFRLLLPQCPEEYRWAETDWTLLRHTMPEHPSVPMEAVMAMLDRLIAEGMADPDRVYIMGISMGGFGTWDALQRWPERFAAAIAICGGGDPKYVDNVKKVPLKIFHGRKDKLVKVCRSQDMYDAIIGAGGKKASLKIYDNLGHFCWDEALKTPGLFEWLFSNRR